MDVSLPDAKVRLRVSERQIERTSVNPWEDRS